MVGTEKNPAMKSPPINTNFISPLGCLHPWFASVVGMATPEISLYVIYNHHNVYPAYIIKYTQVSRP